MVNYNDQELIERYLEGVLSLEETNAFIQRLHDEPQLSTALNKHQLLLESLSLYGRRNDMKQKLNIIHQEMQEEKENKRALISTYHVKALWKKYLPTMAVAASVALITVMGTLFTLDYLHSLENRQITFYKELKRELNNIKINQKSIADAATTSNNPVVTPVSYGGTGFMIGSNGYIVTNNHVISGADSIYIESKIDELCRYKVREVYSDEKSDLAILKIDDPDFTSNIRLSYGFKIKESDLGEPVYTLAFPREDMVYGEGSISSRTGFEGDTSAYQISIPVNPGNSGGPLLDDKGNVIGMITGKNTAVEGAAFAIKSKYLLNLIESIPPDSLQEPILLPNKNLVKELKRPEQIKYLQNLVFNVKVYQHK